MIRLAIVFLVLFNLGLAVALMMSGSRPATDPRALEMNAEQLKVLRSESRGSGSAAASAASGAGAKPGAQVCVEWGAFTAPELERAQAALAKLLPVERVRAREAPEAQSWWVHMPAQKSREEADKKATELKALGVTDYHIVTDNERYRNAISLGIFKTEEAAGAYLAKLRERGVRTAVVAPRANLIRQSVLLVSDPDEPLLGRINELRQEFAGSELKAVRCPGA